MATLNRRAVDFEVEIRCLEQLLADVDGNLQRIKN